ncbi:MAG TPA: hypothetical protein VHL58_04735 [Thermoanaerobaculia bacterium]|nr:hypothetical protein [Thermoanaerobaculia bacterium]
MSLGEWQDRLAIWKRDPVQMVLDEFRVTPDPWQAEALRAFADTKDPRNARIALQACAGPGKSTALAWMGWNFLICYASEGLHPNGAAVSITAENLKNNLWKELAVWRDRSEILKVSFEQTAETIFAREHPKTWFLSARSFAKAADIEAQGRTLSGLHAKFILYLLDESGDMPAAVARSAEQGLSNCTWGKIAQAGNPTSHTGALWEAVKNQPHLWKVIRITGDPDDANRSPRISLSWAKEQIRLHGRDNPWVMAYILGLFPPQSINALLGPDDVARAMHRHLTEDQYNFVQKRIGIDVARFGDDSTVLFPRQGLAARRPIEMRNARSEEIAARIMQGKKKYGSELELIDDTGGYAAGVIDSCRLAGVNLLPVNFSGKADDPRYFNKRSEMYFRAAEWVKGGGALPNMPEVAREAVAATYWFDNGRMRVLEKDQIKKQLNGKSPDFWDAFILTFAVVDLPAKDSPEMVFSGQGHAKTEWDPIE